MLATGNYDKNSCCAMMIIMKQKNIKEESTLKKIINQPENVVEEMLEGAAKAHPEYVRKLEGFNVLVRAMGPVKGKVAMADS
jgi:hypothetical protein